MVPWSLLSSLILSEKALGQKSYRHPPYSTMLISLAPRFCHSSINLHHLKTREHSSCVLLHLLDSQLTYLIYSQHTLGVFSTPLSNRRDDTLKLLSLAPLKEHFNEFTSACEHGHLNSSMGEQMDGSCWDLNHPIIICLIFLWLHRISSSISWPTRKSFIRVGSTPTTSLLSCKVDSSIKNWKKQLNKCN